MKRTQIACLAAALTLAAAPAASAAGTTACGSGRCVLVGSKVTLNSYEAIWNELCSRYGICLNGRPDTPSTPDTDTPDTPDTPDVDAPDTPDEPDIETPDTPDEPDIETPDLPANPDVPDTPDAPDSGTATADSYVTEVVRLVNAERAKAGLSALRMDTTVNAAAQVRAQEIVQSFSHTRPNGTKCFTALAQAGVSYRGAGENIAYGQSSAAAVVNAWMNSEGHRANILNASFTTIGVGHTVVGGTHYWSQFFTY